MAGAEVSGPATMSDLDLGKLLWCELGKTGVTYASVGALARKLCAQPATRGLPAGLVVRPHRVVEGGWESEPTRMYYLRDESGDAWLSMAVCRWKEYHEGKDVTGWCHAEDFQRAMRDGTAVPWVTRTAPRVEWLPWTDSLPQGRWWLVNERGAVWSMRGEPQYTYLMETDAVAYWPADPGLDLPTLTAAILAGEV